MKYLKHKHIDMKNYTETSIVEKTEILEDTEKSKKLVIYNDEVNTFEHVIECLMNNSKRCVSKFIIFATVLFVKLKPIVK